MRGHVFLASLGVAGTAVLVGQLTANTAPPTLAPGGGEDDVASPLGGGEVWDVTPCRVGFLTQFGSLGTYPDGTVALGHSTTGQNVGTVKLPWFQSPNVHHPVIGQNLYRVLADGRLEQIGMSWLKHAWFAVQGTSCGSCDAHSNGRQLGVGCADTYGASLNADQFWLGPRWEVKPNQHLWMDGQAWDGSHFSITEQSGGDSRSHNPVQHRLRVRMGDLTAPGATYYYEGAYWLNKLIGDPRWEDLRELPEDMFNNARHQQVAPSRSGDDFTFDDVGGSVEGPIVWQWGDLQSEASPTDDGVVYVASRSVDLGGGQHRYEYAVYNLSLDREIESIAIPIGGADVTNFGFHAPKDGYWDENGDFVNESPYDIGAWQPSVQGDQVVFAAPQPDGGLEPNTIRYGTLYTFWFDADAPPAPDAPVMKITPHLEGDIPTLAAGVVGPEVQVGGEPATLEGVVVLRGTHVAGDVAELLQSDDEYLQVRSTIGPGLTEPFLNEVQFGFRTDVANPTALHVRLESRLDEPAGIAKVEMKNFNTTDFDPIENYSIGLDEETVTIPNVDPGTYLNPNNGRAKVRVRHVVFGTFFSFNFNSFYDQAELLVE